jgi:hypothetical protein
MMAMWMMTVLGFGIGAAAGGMVGAAAGAVAGMLVGFPVYAVGWIRSHPRNAIPTIERHEVMCFPYGHAAECDFTGDLRGGRWYDVAWCSLKQARPQCDKGCVELLNAARVRPGRACDCEGSDRPSPASVAG